MVRVVNLDEMLQGLNLDIDIKNNDEFSCGSLYERMETCSFFCKLRVFQSAKNCATVQSVDISFHMKINIRCPFWKGFIWESLPLSRFSVEN